MPPIVEENLVPQTHRWVLVAASLAALFVAAVVILAVHAGPATATRDRPHNVDNGL